jgi:DNA polymerase-3 subunit delta'
MIDSWADVLGQPDAVARLKASVDTPVHAYLFVGPPGSGKRAAVRAFAAELFAAREADPDAADRQRRLALAEHHPDLVLIEPEGGIFRGGRVASDAESDATVVIREAYRSPTDAALRVVVPVGFHTANEAAIGALLKTIEEPPGRSVMVLLSDLVPEEQATIESRCVRIDFHAVSDEVLRDALVAEGIEPVRAGEVASLAAGDLTRARILATDERLHLRLTAWRDAPLQLDGTGARATDTVDELRSMIDDALAPLVARQEAEVVAFDEEAERYGQRGGSGRRKTLETRHKRIARKFRTDELRAGLATLARAYREEAAVTAHPASPLGALDAIQRTAEALVFNPNEELMLYGLFATLPPLRP